MSRGLIADRLRDLLGAAAVRESPDGVPLVTPGSAEACATLLRTASQAGWKVAVTGGGTWQAPPRRADLYLGTASLSTLGPVHPADLVATAEPGVRWRELAHGLAEHGVWLAHDAPGTDRTLGSVLATGTSGPLAAGFGPLRHHVLGLTVVTGDGRVVRVGGRVVKNVAGYDLGKLVLGTFGAFGIITAVHVRVRVVPRADETLTVSGTRDALLAAALQVLDRGIAPAALELQSPRAGAAEQWTLAVRLVGTDAEVRADRTVIEDVLGARVAIHHGPAARDRWDASLGGATEAPVTLRIGADPAGLDRALDLLALHLDEAAVAWTSVTVPAGVIRWSGEADRVQIARLRRAAAQLEWPITLERAPAETLAAVGHFGAYREGVFRLVQGLRAVFDPARTLVTPLDPQA